VPAHGDGQSQALDRQTAKHKGRPRCGIGKEDESGKGEKESSGHDQQSGVFHGGSFLGDPAATPLRNYKALGGGVHWLSINNTDRKKVSKRVEDWEIVSQVSFRIAEIAS
jgi:hypothetical protein